MAADSLSDYLNPLQIVVSGHRCIYDRQARSYEHAAGDFGREFRRKVRIVNRAWRATFKVPQAINPVRNWQFACNAIIVGHSPVYLLALSLQACFYILALLGYLLRSRPRLPSVLYIPFYFCLVNAASLLGIVSACRGATFATWNTPRTSNMPGASG
jgi:hypothetical protein